MADEMKFLADTVFLAVPPQEALDDPRSKVLGGRWVICNKHDWESPECRGRFVAQEISDQPDAAFYAATPPLEAKRVLFSQWAREKLRAVVL